MPFELRTNMVGVQNPMIPIVKGPYPSSVDILKFGALILYKTELVSQNV